MPFTVRIKTQMSYEQTEELVQRHCKAAFEINFDGLEDHKGMARKVMTISFETEADREKFRAALGGK